MIAPGAIARGTAPAPPAMVLGCVTGFPAPAQPTAAWRRALAPEVLLRVVDADSDAFAVPAGSMPYALFAAGICGARAARLTQSLLAAGHGPAHLMVCPCPCPVPDTLPAPLPCRLTVFAGGRDAAASALWQTCCAGEFTLRVLRDPLAVPPSGPVSPDLALAVKEELGVWPS
jgi:hypothetical protein